MWMQTYTGQRFDFENMPAPKLEDIAHALSMICRFGGHCKRFYSVAEHSVHVMDFVSEHLHWVDPWRIPSTRAALFHDAAEAYTGDVISPIKAEDQFAQDIERMVMAKIASAFGIRTLSDPIIKVADRRVLASEVLELMTEQPPDDWAPFPLIPWDGCKILALPPADAKAMFLAAAHSLGIE